VAFNVYVHGGFEQVKINGPFDVFVYYFYLPWESKTVTYPSPPCIIVAYLFSTTTLTS
jgi:hypothetical protein